MLFPRIGLKNWSIRSIHKGFLRIWVSRNFLYAFINNLYPDNYVVGVSFYIWYNVFNFFVVSVFWAKTVNSFQTDDSKKYFGIISAFGSAGAWLGSQSVLLFLADLPVIAMLCASVGLMLGIVLSNLLNSVSSDIVKKENSGFFYRVFRTIHTN